MAVSDPFVDWTTAEADNSPQGSDTMGRGSATELSGELREIKAQVRSKFLDPSWVEYENLPTSPGGDEAVKNVVPAVITNGSTVTLLGDWTAIATVGRRIRLVYDAATARYAGIVAVSYSDVTGRTVATLDADVSHGGAGGTVSFGAVDPMASSSIFIPELVTVESVPSLVLPVAQGGTGTTTGVGAGPAGGDLTDSYPDPTIAKLQGALLSLDVPNTLATSDVLTYLTGATPKWINQSINDLLQLITPPLDESFGGGMLTLPYAGQTPLMLKWVKTPTVDIPVGKQAAVGPVLWKNNANATAAFPNKYLFSLASVHRDYVAGSTGSDNSYYNGSDRFPPTAPVSNWSVPNAVYANATVSVAAADLDGITVVLGYPSVTSPTETTIKGIYAWCLAFGK